MTLEELVAATSGNKAPFDVKSELPGRTGIYFIVDGHLYGPLSDLIEATRLYVQVVDRIDAMRGNELAAGEGDGCD